MTPSTAVGIKVGLGLGAILALAAFWVVAASMLFVWAGGLGAYFPHPYTTWLLYSQQPNIDKWTKIYLAGSGAVAALPLAGIAVVCVTAMVRPGKKLRRPLFGGLMPIKEGITNNHGHASWPSVADMLKRYPKPKGTHGGVVIGEARRIDLEPVKDIPFNSRDKSTWGLGGKASLLIDDCQSSSPHSLMFVGTGGFKTMSAISTQFHWRGSTVTFDPSCEIGPMVTGWRQKIGQRVVSIGFEEHHQGINVLACIRPDKPGAAARILSMTASMCGEEDGRKDKDSIFNDAGRNLVACILANLIYDTKNLKENPKTVESLIMGVTIPEDEMQKLLRKIYASSESQLARKLAGTVMGTHKETFSGAYFNALTMLGYLLDSENAKLLSGTLDPAEILSGNLSIYVQVPTATLMHSPGVGRVIADSIVNSVILADGKYAEPILFQADEARLLGAMKSLEVVLTMGRKYGLYVQLIYTSLNDMRKIWTEDGIETWLDLVGWSGYAAVSSKTAEALSKAIGKRAVLAVSEGSNSGSSGQGIVGSGSRSKGANESWHEIGRPLIFPDEFKDSRTDEMFVFPRTGRPFRCSMAPYFRRPEMVSEIKNSSYAKLKKAS